MDDAVALPLDPKFARERLESMGGKVMFEKVLTHSDTTGSGRIVIPKSIAEASFPTIDPATGAMSLGLLDTFGKTHQFKYRFWLNNASRMYLVEGTQELQRRYKLAVGDVMMFAKGGDGGIMVAGRKGTKDDVSRKTPAKRSKDKDKAEGAAGTSKGAAGAKRPKPTASQAAAKAAAAPKPPKAAPAPVPAAAAAAAGPAAPHAAAALANAAASKASAKPAAAKPTAAPKLPKIAPPQAQAQAPPPPPPPHHQRQQQAAAQPALPRQSTQVQGVHDPYNAYTYWNGLSLPARMDGVFRAVPPAAAHEAPRVLTQYGFWTAIVSLGGESYQAFFDSRDAADAAFAAAHQG
jgi:hypothetical protein